MQRYKKFFKENSGYTNDFISWCKLAKISNPTEKDIDKFVEQRCIVDSYVKVTILNDMDNKVNFNSFLVTNDKSNINIDHNYNYYKKY